MYINAAFIKLQHDTAYVRIILMYDHFITHRTDFSYFIQFNFNIHVTYVVDTLNLLYRAILMFTMSSPAVTQDTKLEKRCLFVLFHLNHKLMLHQCF